VLFGERHCSIGFSGWARADGEECRNAGGQSRVEHGFAIFREFAGKTMCACESISSIYPFSISLPLLKAGSEETKD